MEKYPESVITISKKGKKEVRILDKRGKFTIYGYKSLETGKMENKKKICLLDGNGDREDYFMIPLKDGRILLIPEKDIKDVKIWNEKEEKEENIF